jgi:hypothetical protein
LEGQSAEEGKVPKRDRSIREENEDGGRDIGFASENEGANVFYQRRLLQQEATSEMV